jgi:adenylate cyclase
MTAPTTDASHWPELTRSRRAIVVVDVVESVRLMQADEADVIDRLRRFVNEVRSRLLPAHGGRLVKSLGDGLLLEFKDVPSAVTTALAMHTCIEPVNLAHAPHSWLRLRVGVHVGNVVSDDIDIYGHDVNLTQRLMTLAQPDEVVVSADVVDLLVPGLDAEVEDLGLCHLKNLSHPLHAFRLRHSPESGRRLPAPAAADDSLCPRIAVIPFSGSAFTAAEAAIGDAVADCVIARLSASGHIRVISRLSTSVMRSRAKSVAEIGRLLGVAYVLSGSYEYDGTQLKLRAELADARTEEVVWVETLGCAMAEFLQAESAPADHLARRLADAVAAG